ncbi:MAG: hypothetical protein IPH75_16120 [bacterium]|nr:hypothetical protein [bacterium]
MKVVEELITWAKTLPAWQADAVRRIWVNRTISETDIIEVYELLKVENGMSTSETVPIPFGKDHVASGTVHQKHTVLKGLLPTKNVNAIVSDAPLRFSYRGVTIVYGDNAAGKSGYSRILKRACRARGATALIYPNVFAATASKEPAQADIYAEIDGKPEEALQWSDGETPPECLANIAVFDAQTARLYVDEANEVRYIPYGLDVFEKLAGLCRALQLRINGEIHALPKDPDIMKDLVGEGKPIPVVSADTTEDLIDERTPFPESDAKRLEELRKELVRLRAQDPTKEAAIWKRLCSRIQQLRLTLGQVRQICSDESVQLLKTKQKELKDSKVAASLAAQQAFGKRACTRNRQRDLALLV